jgi:hypothetical protein
MNRHENQIFTISFSLGTAVGAVQMLPPGVHIFMNWRIFNLDTSRKNVAIVLRKLVESKFRQPDASYDLSVSRKPAA